MNRPDPTKQKIEPLRSPLFNAGPHWVPYITFSVSGEPKAQPRPRAYSLNGKARMYNPNSANEWKKLIGFTGAHVHGHRDPLNEPLRVDCIFLFPRPQRIQAKVYDRWLYGDREFPHCGRPDLDNLLKAVLDALVDSPVISEDKVVIESSCRKYYHAVGEYPGALIRIWKTAETSEIADKNAEISAIMPRNFRGHTGDAEALINKIREKG